MMLIVVYSEEFLTACGGVDSFFDTTNLHKILANAAVLTWQM